MSKWRRLKSRLRPEPVRVWHLVLLLAAALAVAAATVVLVRELGGGRETQVIVAVLASLAPFLFFLGERIDFVEGLQVCAALLVLVGALVGGLVFLGSIEPEPPLGCINSEGRNQTTVSAPNTNVYPAANHASTPSGLLLEGCTVEFDEYCIGAVLDDAHFPEVRDSRWLELSEDELIASADTAGTIPKDQGPSTCPGGKDPPSKLIFRAATFSPAKGLMEVDATAPNAAMIGFALRHEGRWIRLGWDRSPSNEEPEVLVAPPEADPGDEVFAVPCMAFERPIGPEADLHLKKGPVSGKARSFIQPEGKSPRAVSCDAGIAEE